VHLGICAAAVRDPFMGLARARTMWSCMRPIYESMQRDPEFQHLGSALGMAYREVLRLDFQAGHYYVFVPPTQGDDRLPCLVFLHGLGGNTKAYLWVLAQLSQHLKCAVIAPTFGIGNWDQEDSGEFIVAVVREALATLPLDAQRIFLLGYSNGAMGVTRAVVQDPTLFRGLVYLSAVTEDQLFSTPEFSARIADRPMLFLHGGQDQRIPQALIAGTVASLERMGGDVQLKVYEDEDHFLLLARQADMLRDIAEFVGGVGNRE
jgi:predicted esterase